MTSSLRYIVNENVPVPALFQNGTWIATLPQQVYDRELLGLVIQGPTASVARLFMGMISQDAQMDYTQRGQSNTADYSGGPIHVARGMPMIVQWSPNGTSTFTGLENVRATFRVRQVN